MEAAIDQAKGILSFHGGASAATPGGAGADAAAAAAAAVAARLNREIEATMSVVARLRKVDEDTGASSLFVKAVLQAEKGAAGGGGGPSSGRGGGAGGLQTLSYGGALAEGGGAYEDDEEMNRALAASIAFHANQ
jgi:hypothetical protein